MYYYQHSIADFNSATRHLNRIERSIYRDLLEYYYDTEAAISADSLDQVARKILARSEEEKEAMRVVLEEFFVLIDGFYHQSRCDQEISNYQSKVDTARVNGKLGGRPKKENNPEETQPVIENNPEETGSKANQELITNNQELKTKKELIENDFDQFWKICLEQYKRTESSTGSKSKAESQFKRIENRLANENLIGLLTMQANSKIALKREGKFAAQFPHVERWLRDRRWEDQVIQGSGNKKNNDEDLDDWKRYI